MSLINGSNHGFTSEPGQTYFYKLDKSVLVLLLGSLASKLVSVDMPRDAKLPICAVVVLHERVLQCHVLHSLDALASGTSMVLDSVIENKTPSYDYIYR